MDTPLIALKQLFARKQNLIKYRPLVVSTLSNLVV